MRAIDNSQLKDVLNFIQVFLISIVKIKGVKNSKIISQSDVVKIPLQKMQNLAFMSVWQKEFRHNIISLKIPAK